MESVTAIESTTYYTSSYRHGVDEKRRIQIPARWRPKKAGTEFTITLWPISTGGAYLRVLPPSQMAKLMRDIEQMPNGDEKSTLKRIIGGGSDGATLDKSGRMCLPEEMMEKAGITNEAVLVGVLDRFEVWNPERLEKMKMADAIMAPAALRLVG